MSNSCTGSQISFGFPTDSAIAITVDNRHLRRKGQVDRESSLELCDPQTRFHFIRVWVKTSSSGQALPLERDQSISVICLDGKPA
jgi:hypothetical protein